MLRTGRAFSVGSTEYPLDRCQEFRYLERLRERLCCSDAQPAARRKDLKTCRHSDDLDFRELPAQLPDRLQPGHEQVAQYGEEVVKVVGHPAGELPDRLH